MALTDTRTESSVGTGSVDTGTAVAVDAVLGSGDHKTTGRLWMVTSSLVLVAGAVVALLAAIDHADLGSVAFGSDASDFAQIWSAGRTLLLFGGLVPLLIGLAIHIVPLQVGSPSLAFPRGAAAAFWTWFLGTVLLAASYIANGGPGGGRGDMVELWAVSLGLVLLALSWGLVCIAATVLGARAGGMSLDMVPAASWGFLVFSLVSLVSVPIVVAQLLLAYLDETYGFLGTADDRLALLGVMDSVTLAPSVYWLALPTLGIALDAIAVHTGRPIRGHRAALAALGVLAVFAFGADFFAFVSRGRVIAFDNGLLVVTLLVAVLPVLATLGQGSANLKSGSPKVRTPLVAGLLGGLLVLLATSVSILGTIWPIANFIETNFDTTVNLDDAFDLAHTSFHDGVWGLLVGATLLGVIAGAHHWGHKMWGRSLEDKVGLLSALVAAAGGVVWAAGSVIAGFLGQVALPMIEADPPDGVEAMNVVAAIGVGLVLAAAAILALNLLRAAAGQGSAVEPWQGATLEWATTSPPPAANFEGPVMVSSTTPMDDGYRVLVGDAGTAGETSPETSEEEA